MPDQLNSARVLIITSNAGVERDELLMPRDELRNRGAQVTHAAPKPDPVQTVRRDVDKDTVVPPDSSLDEVSENDFDMLVVPGGTVNADRLRVTERAVELAKQFVDAGKPIAAICHGPWLLVDAGLLPGKTLTSYFSLRTDITNAGGAWVDEASVQSPEDGWTLITSRNPGDLVDFVDAITQELVPAL
ncbi:type 1 glutamine amidotransferase domain-containing protein [Nocardia sp. NPDC049220]|uniref:type 1 glutamine amidotransferase domain-containing protein n=1 Tax=Nocardia sp. NPDC049220 TaxID=3155273 RepID=UPI0033DF5B7E